MFPSSWLSKYSKRIELLVNFLLSCFLYICILSPWWSSEKKTEIEKKSLKGLMLRVLSVHPSKTQTSSGNRNADLPGNRLQTAISGWPWGWLTFEEDTGSPTLTKNQLKDWPKIMLHRASTSQHLQEQSYQSENENSIGGGRSGRRLITSKSRTYIHRHTHRPRPMTNIKKRKDIWE